MEKVALILQTENDDLTVFTSLLAEVGLTFDHCTSSCDFSPTLNLSLHSLLFLTPAALKHLKHADFERFSGIVLVLPVGSSFEEKTAVNQVSDLISLETPAHVLASQLKFLTSKYTTSGSASSLTHNLNEKLLNTYPFPVIILADNKIASWNGEFEIFFSLSPYDFLGHDLISFLPPQWNELITSLAAKVDMAPKGLWSETLSSSEYPLQDASFARIFAFEVNDNGELLVGLLPDNASVSKSHHLLFNDALTSDNPCHCHFLENIFRVIRGKIHSMLGFTELLESFHDENDRDRQYLRSIDYTGSSLLNFLDEMVDLARLESGDLEVEPTPITLAGFLAEFKWKYCRNFELKGVNLHTENIGGAIDRYYNIDIRRLNEVLYSIAETLNKYTGHTIIKVTGTPLPTLFEVVYDLSFRIEGFGGGMQAINSSKDVNGTSIDLYPQLKSEVGLLIARRLLEAMGGELKVEFDSHDRFFFKVILRRTLTVSKDDVVKRNSTSVHQLIHSRNSGTILIVDDLKVNREQTRQYLQKFPHLVVLEAESGEEAIRMSHQYYPDLIIIDEKMPKRTGRETAFEIKNSPDLADTKIILMASPTDISKTATLDSFIDDTLDKPLSRQALYDLLLAHIPKIFDLEREEETYTDIFTLSEDGSRQMVDQLIGLISEWKHLTGNLHIPSVIHFGEKIRQIGRDYSCQKLKNWGGIICSSLTGGDFLRIEHELDFYPLLVQEISDKYLGKAISLDLFEHA